MSNKLPGTILITGSNGGLGSRLASGLLEAGHTNIACHFRSSSEGIEAVLQEHGLDPAKHLFKAELTDQTQVQEMELAVSAGLGPIWGVVNLAGKSSNGMSWKLDKSSFMNILEANLLSTFLVSKAFMPAMREQGGGRIINVSSIVGHTGVVGSAHYCAAKAGIEGFTRAIALELASKGITVNCLALGYFDQGIISEVPTDLLEGIKARVPMKRLGHAEELTPLVGYLLSQESAFLTGQVLHLNGGLRL